MNKKKLSKAERSKRRLAEVQKAQLSDFATSPLNRDIITSSIPKTTGDKIKEEKYKLPLAEIRKDLSKNAIFAAFALIVLLVLQRTGWGYDVFRGFLNF